MSYKILIVDDNRGCSDLYKMRFEYDNWKVEVAFFAEDALKIIKKNNFKPDVILLDIMLPKMQGDEFLGIIKDDPETKDIKVVVLTALNFVADKEAFINEKADDFILKINIMPNELVDRVKELIESKK